MVCTCTDKCVAILYYVSVYSAPQRYSTVLKMATMPCVYNIVYYGKGLLCTVLFIIHYTLLCTVYTLLCTVCHVCTVLFIMAKDTEKRFPA